MSDPNSRDRPARRGFLIMAGVVVAAALIFNIDAVVDLTRDHVDLVALVHDAPGIRVGASVWVAGVESGRVTRVGFAPRHDSARIAIDVRLDGRALRLIRRDSDVYTGNRRFIGEPIVQITAGTHDGEDVAEGDTLFAKPRPSPEELIEQMAELPAALDSLLDTVDRIGERTGGRTDQLAALLDRTAALSEVADRMARDMEGGSLARLLDDGGLADRVGAVKERVAALAVAADRVVQRYTGPDASLPRRLDRLSVRADSLSAELEAVRRELETGHGFLGRMSRDSALQVAVSGVRAQMDTLIAEAQSIALRMLLP